MGQNISEIPFDQFLAEFVLVYSHKNTRINATAGFQFTEIFEFNSFPSIFSISSLIL